MSIDWKKPIRTVNTKCPVNYKQLLDNLAQKLHLVEIYDDLIVVKDDGTLPGDSRSFLENVPEEKWKIVATTKETYASKAEAEAVMRELFFKHNWEVISQRQYK